MYVACPDVLTLAHVGSRWLTLSLFVRQFLSMISLSHRLTLAAVLLATFSHVGEAQYNNCIPPSPRGERAGNLDSLRGSTLLIAYATAGPQKGRISSGTLDLQPATPALREKGWILTGITSIDLARIGAQFNGSLHGRDPGAPSVTVEAATDGRPAVMILGSIRERNAKGELTGPVTRFEIMERFPRGYRGLWKTINAKGAAASGYFCASRF